MPTRRNKHALLHLLEEIHRFDRTLAAAVCEFEGWQEPSTTTNRYTPDLSLLTVEATHLANQLWHDRALQQLLTSEDSSLRVRIVILSAMHYARDFVWAYEGYLGYGFALKYEDSLCLFCELGLREKWCDLMAWGD
ncbi:hypothetical protein B0A55_01369 [Friedmanniomyces simplex]|uniref:Uncharacterized protein n=1 Tax=Friedmanniomyces simplex TaxID=329884 RepID=A0A4U0Y2K6_9PEZI|nr:hypothetical protein B0A55_01369 [Friedmanniomyces simplex]